jgi:dihydrofolate synthase/folylpolyglutamate synthase
MRFDSLAGWLAWQASLNPRSIDLGLERVGRVWSLLGAPALGAPVLTVAGTNGKGSSVAFAEAMLQAAGYRTGCFTSPHLQRYNERVRIDGAQATDAALCAVFARIDAARNEIPLTFFEFGTLAALLLFADADLDAVVLEVGLGGRLDAVNIVDADVALITRIGLDHQAWLGDDLDSIAREKAGIMRPGVPAVYAADAIPAGIREVAGQDYRVVRRADAWDLLGPHRQRHALPLPGMRGPHQVDNAAGVLVALDCLGDRLALGQQAARAGLLAAKAPGRFDVRPGAPTLVLDVAHNPQAAAVFDGLLGELFCPGRRVAVCGLLGDKDAAGFAQALARRFDAWHLVELGDQARGLAAAELAARLRPVLPGTPVHADGRVGDTLSRLLPTLGADDQVVVFGSFLTVGQALDWLDDRD